MVAHGFEVLSPCGRVWFVPFVVVHKDHVDFTVELDGIGLEEATKQANEDLEFLDTWFRKQFRWQAIDLYGILVKDASQEDIKVALYYGRDTSNTMPHNDYIKYIPG